MLKKIKALVFISLLSIAAAGCGGGGGGSDVNRTIDESASGWTIMVWLDGDNNLESAAMEDFNEMEYGLYLASLGDPSVTDKIKIIVQVDRYTSNSTAYTGDKWSDTRRYIIRPDSSNSTSWTSQRIDNGLGEVNMGDVNNLKDFIEYCHEHFPAPHYALILWNHGGGLRKKVSELTVSDTGSKSYSLETVSAADSPSKAICWDETDSDDALYTSEITDVLTDEDSVDFLGFDACLMGMLEVAYEYRPGISGKFGADAICFSPASEQGDGWDYARIFNRLKGSGADGESDTCYDADSLTAKEFAELVAKEYRDFCVAEGDTDQTMTAVDNTKVTTVKSALDAFAVAYSSSTSTLESVRGSGSSVNTMHYFDETDADEWYAYPFFDLYDFAERMNSASANSKARDLMTAVSNFILYSYGGSSYSGFTNKENGLSFFFTDGDGAYNGTTYMAYQWWYTSVNTNSVRTGWYYGSLDFCDKGSTDGTVENWYELIVYMYLTPSLASSGFWPSPAY